MRFLTRIPSLLLIAFSFALSVNCYTVALKNGKRVQLPSDFTLTNQFISYSAGDHINVMILLSMVDLAKTERLNSESLASYYNSRVVQAQPDDTGSGRAKTLTIVNKPSIELVERRAVESTEEIRKITTGINRLDDATSRHERRWRMRAGEHRARVAALNARAAALRASIHAVNEQLNYRYSHLLNLDAPHGLVTRPGFYGIGPYGYQYEVVNPEIQVRMKELTHLTLQLRDVEIEQAVAREAGEQLEEDARRDGAYPGWLR